MRTVQMTLDEKLVAEVDRAARRLGISRSAFAREALNARLRRLRVEAAERRHAEGYRDKPVKKGEFDFDESAVSWGDE